jgi:hypothetical protein
MSWTIPEKSINAVTLSSASQTLGATINLDEVKADHACQAIVTTFAAGDQAAVHLEGSLDGANWYTLATAGIPAGGASGAGTVTALLSGAGVARFVRTTVPAGGVAGSPVLTTFHTSS